MILKTITKTKIFLVSLLSFIIAIFLAFSIFDNLNFRMHFWIPLLIYFILQCYILYLSIRTQIKKIWITSLINAIIALILCLSLTWFLIICTAVGAMRG